MHDARVELPSETLLDYLKNQGWIHVESEPDIAILRKMYDDQEEEIVLPLDRKYVDYSIRVTEAVRVLAALENRTERGILDEVLLQKWDVLRIRIRGDRIGAGYISYFDKRIIEEGVRKMLLASARYVLDPKAHFKRLYSNNGEQWMKKCRAGAAESGSYILSIQMPLEEKIDSLEVPYSRRVGEYFMTSLYDLVTLVQNQEMPEHNSHHQLNMNLCLGLAEMKPDETPIHFDFEMKWSSEFPAPNNIPNKIEIRDDYFSSVLHIGQKLTPQSKENQDVFIGKVWALDGEANEEGKMQGEVTLALFLDEQQVKAKVSLEPKYYSLVCDAHKQNQYIRISGILTEKPRFSELREISHFEIIT